MCFLLNCHDFNFRSTLSRIGGSGLVAAVGVEGVYWGNMGIKNKWRLHETTIGLGFRDYGKENESYKRNYYIGLGLRDNGQEKGNYP